LISGVFTSRKDNISFIRNVMTYRLMRYIYLSHKYDWRHVTDT